MKNDFVFDGNMMIYWYIVDGRVVIYFDGIFYISVFRIWISNNKFELYFNWNICVKVYFFKIILLFLVNGYLGILIVKDN